MADREIDIRVKVDATGAVSTFDALGNEIKKVEGVTTQAQGGFTRFEASLVAAQAAAVLVTGGILAASNALGALFDAIAEGDKINDVADAFEAMAAAAGATSDVLLGQLNKATAESVTNFDLMKAANDALLAGLKPDQFIAVATAAKRYGDALGIDAKTAIDQLSNAIQSGSERALKQYGIFIDNTQVLEEYAKTVGKTTEQLTAAEQIEAKRSAALEQLAENTRGMTNEAKSAGDQLEVLNKLLEDGSADLKSSADRSVILASALKLVNEQIRKLFSADVFGGFNKLDIALLGLAKSASYLLMGLGRLQEGQALGGLIDKQLDTITTTKMLEAVMGTLGDGITEVVKDYGLGAAAADKMAVAQTSVAAETKKAKEELEKLPGVLVAVSNEFQNGVFEGSIDDLLGGGGSNATAKIADGSFFGFDLGTGFSGLEDALTQGIGDALSNALNAVFSGDTLHSGDYGNMLGDLAGGVADSFLPGSGGIADALVTGFVGMFAGSDSAGTKARKSADKFFADAFDANRLAVIINGELTEIKDLVFKGDTLFGGNVDFGGGGFDTFFQSLGPAIRAGFQGVGAGFEELLGVTEDMSGQMAAVLSNNVGGSLNNLQLLVQSSGQSFEQLHDSVVAAFEDGKLSAAEAQVALQGIAQVAQKGIPDGIGFTVQAFENLEAAGKKGGRVSIDALQDIGFEAKELGIKDFPALIKNIEASGKFTSKEIQQVFQSLQAHGINSVEQLTAATTEQLIPVLAQLEQQSFPFKEANQDIRDLIKTVNEIPDRIEKNLHFNITASADSSLAEQAVNQTGANFQTGQTGGNGQGLPPHLT